MKNAKDVKDVKETKVQQLQKLLSSIPVAEEIRKEKEKTLMERLQSFKNISRRISDSVNDSLAIKELLPEVSYIEQVLVSSILNPNDIGSDAAKIIVSDFTDSDKIDIALDIVEDAVKEAFDFKTKMPAIIGEALFTHGSYTILTLPNRMAIYMASLEREKEEKNKRKRDVNDTLVAVENIVADFEKKTKSDKNGITSNITMEFNPLLLFKSDIKKIQHDVAERAVCGFENILEMDSVEISSDSGNAIVKRLPTEAFIPIHAPGDIYKQIGGILLLDSVTGMPIDTVREARYFEQLRNSKENDNDYARMAAAMGVRANVDDRDFLETVRTTYTNIVNREIRKVMASKGKDVTSVVSDGAIIDALIAREASKQGVQMVYLPESVFTYFAFNIDQSGVGVSLIEKNKFFISLRVRLFIAEALAGIRNSTPLTKVSLTIDDEENEPNQIIDMVLTEAISCLPDQLDDHSFNPSDIFASLKRASVMLEIDGGESLPGTKITMTDEQRNQVKPDSDIVERVYKQCCLGFGVPADIVDRALQGDFAAGIALSSAIFIRSIEMKQTTFDNDASEFYKKFILASPAVYKKLTDALGEDKVDDFISGLRHQLPRADSTVYSEQNSVIGDYKSLVTTVAEIYFTEDAFSGISDDLAVKGMLNTARTNFINAAMRDFIRSKNLLPEVSNITGKEDIKKLVENIDGANQDSVAFTHLLVEATKKMAQKANKEMEELNAKLAPPAPEPQADSAAPAAPGADGVEAPPTEPNFDEASGGDDMAPPVDETAEPTPEGTEDGLAPPEGTEDEMAPPDATEPTPEGTEDEMAPPDADEPPAPTSEGVADDELAPPSDFEEEMEPPV